MREQIRECWRFRHLLYQFVAREMRIRYKNSALGFLWSIIPILLQVMVYSFFVKGALGVESPNYTAYLLCGLIPWTFFSVAIQDSSQSILVNIGIVKKVAFPREIIPLAFIVINFIHFMLSWSVFFVAFFLIAHSFGIHIPLQKTTVFFPLITLLMLALVMGVSLWICILNTFYEDVRFIVQTLLNLALFVMPVLLTADAIYYTNVMRQNPWLFKLYLLNPVASFITAFRHCLLEKTPTNSIGGNKPLDMDWAMFGGACALTLLILWSGYWYFNLRKWDIVERHR